MSYYIQLSLSWNDSDHNKGSVQTDHVVDAARSFVLKQQWSEHVLEDLRDSCGSELLGRPGFKSVMSFGVIELLRSVSQQLPDVTFYAKGAGEEFGDIWLREYRAGVVVKENGPFDEYTAPIPEELLAQAKAAVAAEDDRMAKSQKKSHWLSKLLNR